MKRVSWLIIGAVSGAVIGGCMASGVGRHEESGLETAVLVFYFLFLGLVGGLIADVRFRRK